MPKPTPTGHQLSVWLPPEAHAQVAEIAKDEAISMVAVIRRATLRELRRRDVKRTKVGS